MIDSASYPFLDPVSGFPYARPVLGLLALLLVAWIANWLTRRILLQVVVRVAAASPMHWDEALMGRKVLAKLAHVVPALIIASGIPLVPDLHPAVVTVVRNVALAFVALVVAQALARMLDAVNDLYVGHSPRAHERPIKGYLQVA